MALTTRTVLCRLTTASVVIVAGAPQIQAQLEPIVIATNGSYETPVIMCNLDPAAAASTFGATMRAAVDAWAAANGFVTPVNNLFIPSFTKV